MTYGVADLLSPPPSWTRAFDLVIESYTLQVLPPAERPAAIKRISSFVAPIGMLLVIARGREPEDDEGKMPWPLPRAELEQFTQHGLSEIVFEDFLDIEIPPVRRFRVEYGRPQV